MWGQSVEQPCVPQLRRPEASRPAPVYALESPSLPRCQIYPPVKPSVRHPCSEADLATVYNKLLWNPAFMGWHMASNQPWAKWRWKTDHRYANGLKRAMHHLEPAPSSRDRHWVDAQEALLASISQKDAATVDDVDCGPDDLTCAICLCQPEPVDLAIIKGCEHNYCGEAWA